MHFLRELFLVLHLLGFAMLFGGLFVQVREPVKRIHPLMRDGIGTAVVAGLVLFGLISSETPHPSTAWQYKMLVKLAVAVVILVFTMMNMRKERISTKLWAGLLLLTVANVCLAVFWNAAAPSL